MANTVLGAKQISKRFGALVVLDRVDLHEGFNPRADYQLTIGDVELTTIERHAAAGTSVDEIELEL